MRTGKSINMILTDSRGNMGDCIVCSKSLHPLDIFYEQYNLGFWQFGITTSLAIFPLIYHDDRKSFNFKL